eukprot:Ihof_evm29s27 gene=Ihof_evmTU29s27
MDREGSFETPPSSPRSRGVDSRNTQNQGSNSVAIATRDQSTQTDIRNMLDEPVAPWMWMFAVFLIWLALGWVVGIAGLAGTKDTFIGFDLSSDCAVFQMPAFGNISVPLCSPAVGQLGYFFFAYFLELAFALGLGVAIWFGNLRIYRQTLNVVLIVASSLLITCADTCKTMTHIKSALVERDAKTCLAGTVMLLMGNFILFVLLSVSDTTIVYKKIYAPHWHIPRPRWSRRTSGTPCPFHSSCD